MTVAFRSILLILAIIILAEDVHSREEWQRWNPWSKPLSPVVRTLNRVLSLSYTMKEDGSVNSFDSFWKIMTDFPLSMKQFKESRLCSPETRNVMPRNDYLKDISNDIKDADQVKRDLQNTVKRPPADNVLDRILYTQLNLKKEISHYVNQPLRGDMYPEFELRLDRICPRDRDINALEEEMSIKDVCQDVETCATRSKRFQNPHLRGWFPDLREGCGRGQNSRKCDLVKAFPVMATIFWYQLNNWITKRICIQRCDSWNHQVNEGYMKLLEEAKLLRAYGSILPTIWDNTWKKFFNQAVERNAYTNIEVAMSMVLEKEKFLNSTINACNALKFSKACPYADIFVEYLLIRKSQKKRLNPSPVKDLRLYSNLDHGKMLGLQKDTSHHLELLGQIRNLGENLKVSVSGISTYFQGVAKYDEGIADKDVLYIQGEIDKFNNSITDVVEKVKEDIKSIMDLVLAQMSLALLQEVADLAMIAAENSNPLKLFFSGPDLDEIAAAVNAIAEASVDVAAIEALRSAAEELGKDTREIALALYNNQDQITGLQALVDDIRQNRTVSVQKHADKFIEEYGDYTPQTNRSALEKNNALWSAFKDAACDLADDDVGVVGAIIKGKLKGGLLCEKLEGTLAQFFTLREDIFEFQFQVVDAVAQVVRGSISKRLSEGIRGKDDLLHASQLMIGFFMMQNKLQNVASAYCDLLEYQRLGRPISACSTRNGLFRYENLDDLVAFEDKSPYTTIEREVFIPTRASFFGDTGYISLSALKSGKSVFFKLPVNETWLLKNRWILPGQKDVPFVESLSIYLPRKEYQTGRQQQHYTTKIIATTNGGSSVNTEDPITRVVYILPKGHSSYLTVYEEGYDFCSREIDNPYSLCNNLPKLCDTSERQVGESVMPTILSTWKIKLTVSKGRENVPWDGLTSSTDLKIRAKVKLRVPMSQVTKKKRSLGKAEKPHPRRYRVEWTINGCCPVNRYRISTENHRCANCPRSSDSRHGGLYCETCEVRY